VGVPIQKENEAPLGPEAKVEENWEEVSLLINSVWGLGERRELSQRVRGGAPVENGFIVI